MSRARIAILLALTTPAIACLWDYDTLQMERQRFPETLELITGKFLRHSKEFYEWRVQDRLKRLAADPKNLELLDDLAVAYEKTGDHAKAIETMERAQAIQPDRYETLANLGTFYFHSGQLAKGLPCIAKAIEINPKAHFGREVYQKLLVEYVLSKAPDGKPSLPFNPGRRQTRSNGFCEYCRAHGEANYPLGDAVRGVLGMMKFGTYDSPILLEALGDILLGEESVDPQLLATRAYLQASYVVNDPNARAKYREMAQSALEVRPQPKGAHEKFTFEEIERDFGVELKDAQDWYSGVRADELAWIRDGKDVDAEFAAKYYQTPTSIRTSSGPFLGIRGGGCLAVSVACLFLAWVMSAVQRRRARQ